MSRQLIFLGMLVLIIGVGAGCSQPVPALPTPTPRATAYPTVPIAPTATRTPPPATVPTAGPAFPLPGRSITIIVPSPVGGVADSGARLLAPALERQIGAPVQVSNRIGPAATEAAAGDLAASQPDGYTLIMLGLPDCLPDYLDPARSASFGRADFASVAGVFVDRLVVAVRTESMFAIPQDVVDYARSHPRGFAVGTNGTLGAGHLAALDWAQTADVHFAYFPFPSSIEAVARLLIGRLDAAIVTVSSLGANHRTGAVRLLGVVDDQESPLLPGVPTLAAQGQAVSAPTYYLLAAPAGTPRGVMGALSAAVRKAAESDVYRTKLAEIGVEARYMPPADLDAYWSDRESWAKPLIELWQK